MSDGAIAACARELVAPARGILAADESTPTMTRRLAEHHIASTEWSRRDWRELLITTPNLSRWISGVILYDETVDQHTADGKRFPDAITARGMLPGIKVDTGAKPFPGHDGEKLTDGLVELPERLRRYRQLGLRFTKWRAVITIDDQHRLPSTDCVERNAQRLATYAAVCQREGLVPIVEPEVLSDGDHSIDRCAEVTEHTLRAMFTQLDAQRVALDGLLLKPNMVLPGRDCPTAADVEEVATATLRCMADAVPPAVAGIVFLSGGQSPREATEHLGAINGHGPQPWPLSFSFGRALQQPPLAVWRGDPARARDAQAAFSERAQANSLARQPSPPPPAGGA
jgi:fructose-bisphosphate aldolase class I